MLLLLNKIEYEEADIEAITQSIAQIILKGVGLTIPSHLEKCSDNT